MSSKYYNPRLAKNLADAYRQEVYDFATPVEKAFDPFVQMTREDYERKMKEKEKYEAAMERIRKEQNADFGNMRSFDPNKVAPEFRDYATQESINLQQEYRWTVENLEGFAKIQRLDQINNRLDDLTNQNKIFAAYQEDYKDRRNPDQDGGDRTSKVNSAEVNYIDNKKANREWDEIIKVNGRTAFVFKAESSGGILDEDIVIPIDDFATAYTPIERQTKKYTNVLAEFDQMIDTSKRELRWENDPENKSQLESKLGSMEFTKEEAMSIAIDYLGMSEEAYAGTIMKDIDGDGRPGTIDDINKFIKDNIRQGVTTTLTNLRRAYEDRLQKQKDEAAGTLSASEINRLEKLNRVRETTKKVFDIKFPTDDRGNIDITSPMFYNQLADAGFTISGDPFTIDGVKFVNIKNNSTNDTTIISTTDLFENDLKRVLMTLAGDTQENIDMLFKKTTVGPQTEGESQVTLPGLFTPQK